MKKTSDRDLIYTLQNYFATNYECRINVATDTLLFMAADRIKELRKQVNDLRKENNDLRKENSAGLAAELEEAEKRIAELETLIKVAAGGGQEICPRCNQEMGSPHYCRPDWSGPSIGGKVVSDE